MRDLPQEFWLPLKAAQDRLREVFFLHGYRVLETPVLEATELFLRKSGGELAARLYSFSDQGGNRVSLRPEYTASILRHYLEQSEPSPLPVRVQYAGPVFRHQEDGFLDRQFTQAGAELLGSSDPRADAEIMSLCCHALLSLGLDGHRLEIGDIGIPRRILESLGLSERAIVFILGSISELAEGPDGLAKVKERAEQLRLLAAGPRQTDLGAAIREMEENKARELLHGLLEWAQAGSLGQREPTDIVERLLRKFQGSDDPARFQQGLEVAYELAGINGDAKGCLEEAGKLIKSYDLDPSTTDRLRNVMGLLDEVQPSGTTLVLDFGLARGLAYYTGIVFEIWHPTSDVSLGGGGRYDGLARALGSHSGIAALGFAYNLEQLVYALESAGNPAKGADDAGEGVLVVASEATGYKEGLLLARKLRSEGTPVEMDVCGMSVEESLSYARSRGIAEVIVVDGDGNPTSYKPGES